MEDIEEGELPSSPEADAPYHPLPRPELSSIRKSIEKYAAEEEEASDDQDNSEDEDSDYESNHKAKRMFQASNSRMDVESGDGGGSMFKTMAAKFQSERKTKEKRNNVWGSILQEETLTSEMTGIGVGRSIKDVDSDRGAETYDYFLAIESASSSRPSSKLQQDDSKAEHLDKDMDEYWDKRKSSDAIQAGRKRSIKDRLGAKKSSSPSCTDFDAFENMSIPPPGVARTIPDLSQALLESLNEVMDDQDEDKNSLLGEELASKLSEPKADLMIGVVEEFGTDIALELFKKSQDIEATGGMMIKNGERRRTPGGVFLQLLRDMGADENEPRVDSHQIKRFFAAQTNKDRRQTMMRKPRGDFKSELESFKASLASRQEPADDNDEELKPLPDLLACISSAKTKVDAETPTPDTPEAPPNSVERSVNSYDDDFLTTEAETEDIELL